MVNGMLPQHVAISGLITFLPVFCDDEASSLATKTLIHSTVSCSQDDLKECTGYLQGENNKLSYLNSVRIRVR